MTILPLAILAATLSLSPDSNDIYRVQADQFIASGKLSVQQAQTAAIRQAIDGKPQALQAIRQGRSQTDYADHRVRVSQIAPNLRLYTPTTQSSKPRPILLYLHGGGWCIGSINSCSRYCTELSAGADILIAALDYRLAPEHPYPSALQDISQALDHIVSHAQDIGADTTHISIGGDSSGGNLAIVSSLQTSHPIHSLILYYPVTNVSRPYEPSWQQYASGYACDAEIMEAFTDAYIPYDERTLPTVSPLLLPDADISRLPPTLIVAAERDVLYDQGVEFAKRLRQNQIPVTHITLPGSIHLFITVPHQDAAFRQSVQLTKTFLKDKYNIIPGSFLRP